MAKKTANPIRRRLRTALDRFDSELVLGEIAGLFTCPENAAFGLRLGNLAELAAVSPVHGGRAPSRRDVHGLANGADIRHMSAGEDPAEFSITEPIGFEGRVYAAFTGQGQEEVYRAECLFRAVDRLHHTSATAFTTHARNLVLAALEIGDEVARRSGVGRAEPGKMSAGVVVPPAELRRRVTFTSTELASLLNAAGVPRDALDPLVSELGDGRDDIDPDHGAQSTRPVVRLPNGSVVVVHHLLRAIAHQILVIAHREGTLADLAEALADSVAGAVEETLVRVSRLEPDGAFVPTVARPPAVRLAIYRAEPDAIVVAVTVCDPLAPFALAKPHGEWMQTKLQHKAVSAYAKEAVDWAKANAAPDQEVLALTAFGGIPGRSSGHRYPDVGKGVEQLGMEAGALFIAAATERDDCLALLRFAISRREAHDRMHVFAFSPLDEFAFFHDHGRGFYVSDDQPLTGMMVTSDYARDTRQAVHDSLDRQSAPGPFGPATRHIELVRRYEEEGAPIYFPWWPLPGPAMVVRFPEADIWITAPVASAIPDEGFPLYVDVLNALAFWVWELAPHVIAASPRPTGGPLRKSIAFQIEDVEDWGSKSPTPVGPDSVIAGVVSSDEGQVALHRSFSDGLMGADNRGERFMVANLVGLLFELFGGPTDQTQMAMIVEQVAPLGPKKMLILLPEDGSQEIGPPTGLPRQPKVSDWETERLLDGLATKLEADGLRPGPSGTPAEQSALTNRAVGFFFETMKAQVAELAPDGLIESLLARNETALREVALGKLQIPTRIACFGPHSDMAAKLSDEARALTKASIANRFLVEFVAASPPTGTMPLTPARYERLLTAASVIVEYGYQSDIALYELGATSVRVLPSGRLGVQSTDFQKAVGVHRGQMIPVQIRNALQGFANHWKTSGPPGPPPADLDAAFTPEFGYDLNAFRLVLQALADASAVGQPVSHRLRSEVVADAVALGVMQADAERVVDDLTLGPRASFVAAPPGFVGLDIWPWLFNRRLSLIRRPLVARGTGDPELVWGFRGIVTAAQQVLGLISEGRLPFPQAKAMKDFQSRLSNVSSDEFVADVAAMLVRPGRDVRTKVDKFGRVRLENAPGHTLGDVDVLAIDHVSHTLFAVECKDLVFAKTPRELSSELRELEEPDQGMIVKHQRRATWMTNHMGDVVAGLGLSAGQWRVVPLLAVSAPLPSVHLRPLGLPVVLVHDLVSWLDSYRPPPNPRPAATHRPGRRGGGQKRSGRGRRI